MSTYINKDCSCICPDEIKYSCDANGLCYQDDGGQYSSVAECIASVKNGSCGKFIRLSSNYLPWDADPIFLIGELSVTNTINSTIVYSLENSTTFIDNNEFIITDNKLKFISTPNYSIQKSYNIYIKAIIDDAIVLFDMLTIQVTPDPSVYETFIEAGNNITINTNHGISVTFDSISTSGFLFIQNDISNSLPIFDVSTTAQYTGNIKICATVPSGSDLYNTNLVHFNSGIFVDVPTISVNETTREICGIVTSLSPFVLQTQTTDSENVPTLSLGDMESQVNNIFTTITSGGNSVQTIYNPDGSFSHFETQYIECEGNQTYTVQNIYSPLTGQCGCWETALSLGAVISAIELLSTAFFAFKAIMSGIKASAAAIAALAKQLAETTAAKNLLEASSDLSLTIIKQLYDELANIIPQIEDISEDINIKDGILQALYKKLDEATPRAPDGTIILDEFPANREQIEKVIIQVQSEIAEKQTTKAALQTKGQEVLNNIASEENELLDLQNQIQTKYIDIENINIGMNNEQMNYKSLLVQSAALLASAYAAYEAFNNIPVLVAPKTCPEGETLNNNTCECEVIDYSDYTVSP